VDQFYGALLERQQDQRPYAQFSSQYVEIESELRSLVTRNQVRPLNQESTKISQTILDLWQKYKAAHQKTNGYTTAIATLHRNRFTRLFNAAASAEEAKKLPAEDRDTSKE
jgi:predicted secreted Zn-dependent protease